MKDKVRDILSSGKRDRMEIFAAIAAMTQKPSRITPIKYQVNLSYPMLRKYIALMLELDLIESLKVVEKDNKAGRAFRATEKGFMFLKIYCDILRIVYGEGFLHKTNNLAVTCIEYCKEAELASLK